MMDFADEGVSKVGKTFKEGGHVRVRILGMRHLEGIAMGTLKVTSSLISLAIGSPSFFFIIAFYVLYFAFLIVARI